MNSYSHETHVRHSFDSFCKKLLKNEARNHLDEMRRRRNRETSLTDLTRQEEERLVITDRYPSEDFVFSVLGYEIVVCDERIAEAITALPDEKRDIILLAYFLDMTDATIGERLNLVRRTVHYKRTSSLQELKKLLEGRANE